MSSLEFQRGDAEGAETAEKIKTKPCWALSGDILAAAIEVHSILGPGLLESVYEAALILELKLRDIDTQSQVFVPLNYKGQELSQTLKLDLLVANLVVVEIKCVESVLPVHKAQLLSYLRLSGIELGLLLNFNVSRLALGVHRVINTKSHEPTRSKDKKTSAFSATSAPPR